jgi:adenylate kinase
MIMRRGALVPDEVLTEMMAERLCGSDTARGYILDGFPRTIQQALWLDEHLAVHRWAGLLAIICLEIDPQRVVERVLHRTVCPFCNTVYNTRSMPSKEKGICDHDGSVLIRRSDDNVEILLRRLETFERETEPLIEHYQDYPLFMRIDADRGVSVITEEIAAGMEHRFALMTDGGQIRAENSGRYVYRSFNPKQSVLHSL